MKNNLYIKPISYRQTKNGNWVILADKSELLVVDEITGKGLIEKEKCIYECEEIMSILYENGFLTDSQECSKEIPNEKKDFKWMFMKCFLFIVGFFSVFLVLILAPFIGIPIGNELISSEVPLWISFIFIIVFSIATTFLHELMHIIYAQNWRMKFGGANLSIKKATAVVSMTHVWAWSFTGRIAAVSAGVILDLSILACFYLAQLLCDYWIITVASSVLWLKILWQFRFNKNCDGKILAMMIIDNPMIDIDASELKNKNSKNRELKKWIRLKITGLIIEIIIFVFWVIPLLLAVCKEVIR